MADTISGSSELKVGLKFDDADTRIITVPNPANNLTKATIENAFSDTVSQNIFIGDKAGASLTGLYTAYKDDTTRTKLDISGN